MSIKDLREHIQELRKKYEQRVEWSQRGCDISEANLTYRATWETAVCDMKILEKEAVKVENGK